ncbi:MAG: hypothetical protein ACTSO9_17230 [Candidatus Helarchaeota archaeon]
MVREHNTRFQRFLAGLGKRYLRWRKKKMNSLFLSILILEFVRILTEFIHDGNLELALDDFYEIGKIAGDDLLLENIGAAKLLFSKDIKDSPLMTRVASYLALGEDIPDRNFQFVPKNTDGDKYDRLIWSYDQCIFCACLDKEKELEINKKTMGNQTWGCQVAGIFEAVMQTIQNYVGNKYEIICKETKCIMKGDAYNEYTMWFIPLDA